GPIHTGPFHGRRDGTAQNGSLNPAESFVVREEEKLVLAIEYVRNDYRSANGRSKLVLPEFALLDVVRIFKEVRRIQFVVAEKFPARTVKLVGTGLDGGIENSGARPAKLGAEVRGLHLEFLNGVDGGKDNKVRAVQEVDGVRVIVNAVKEVVVLRGPIAVGGKGAARSVTAGVCLRRIHARG